MTILVWKQTSQEKWVRGRRVWYHTSQVQPDRRATKNKNSDNSAIKCIINDNFLMYAILYFRPTYVWRLFFYEVCELCYVSFTYINLTEKPTGMD